MDSRDGSRDRSESRLVKHQHSFSESGRISVPMWDSSDPDRAPPPLPLNPGANVGSPITKANVSSNIEKAAALIASRAIDNTPSAYTSNPPPNSSPERMKPQHRRMQSIQTGSVGRLSDSLERRSPDKGLSRSKLVDVDDFRTSRSLERSPVRSGSETPTPPGRVVHQENSGSDENTPPPKMLALQSVRSKQDSENPLSDISNGASNSRSNMSLDSLSTQILNITSIATNLQREMANLSRRSKDNATDLFSLREATTSRDEDIRKSLKDLVTSLDNKFTSIDSRMLGVPEAARSTPNLGLFIDDRAHDTPTRKTIHLPRMASPASFLDREIIESPSVVSVDGAASIALLEKVLREMATKDGQEKIMGTLESVKTYAQTKTSQAVTTNSQPTIDPAMMKKLEEILVFMKDMRADSGSRALVKADLNRSPSQIDLYLDKANQVTKTRNGEEKRTATVASGADFVSEEVLKVLKSVKQSLSQNGGLTNEVKALVRELRGEVLGMGREISRKLEEVDTAEKTGPVQLQGTAPEDVTRIVNSGLAELKEHMHHIVQENRKQSTLSAKSAVDTQQVVFAVQQAIQGMQSLQQAGSTRDMAGEREEMLVAIKEAWEDCKPEIALEHFGLERDEILETLKEGLKSFTPQQQLHPEANGITYEQVLEAIQQGLEDFKIPQIPTQASVTREEILSTIQDCLENFNFANVIAPSQITTTSTDLSRDEIVDAVKEVLSLQMSHPREAGITKDDVLDAVRQEYSAQNHVTKEIEFNREDLFDAIKACLEGEQNPLGGMGERVVEAMHEFLGSMKTEFQQYSAANGRDTEQVLDALKDGLEDLRGEIETYVDRAADVTGKDEIIDIVKAGFAAMQADMDKGFAGRTQSAVNTPEMLDAMEKEFEHLRDTISKSMSRAGVGTDKDDILDAIRDITDDRQSSLSSNSEDIVRLVKDELEHMRTTLASTLMKSGGSLEREDVLDAIREGMEISRTMPRPDGNESVLSNTSELLDAFQEGVDGLRSDMQKLVSKPADLSTSYEILDTLKLGIESVRADIQRLQDKHDDTSDTGTARGGEVMLHAGNNISTEIEGLKVMITQLRIKVEALDNMPIPEPVFPREMRVHKDDLADLHEAIREVHDSVHNVPRTIPTPQVVMPAGSAMKEDTEAIETLLRNVKAQVDGLVMPELDGVAKTSHLMSIEDALREIKTSVLLGVTRSTDSNNKEDFTIIELLLKDVQASIEGLQFKRDGPSMDDEAQLSKTDLQVLESICLETREKLEELSLPSLENLVCREDIAEMKDTIVAFREQFEADNDLTAQAFEARKIEHGGLASKIDDVKSIIGEVREELMSKLNGSEEGIVELAKVLGMHHDNMSSYATAENLAELSNLVVHNFDSHMEHHSSSRTEMEERDATLFSKHEETSSELRAKIEDKFTELMTKYDDAQVSNDMKLNALDNRDKAHLEATTSVKIIVEDLKLLMDTLGSTVSETCDKMATDSRTVFQKVDDANVKLGDLHATNAHEHGLTRDEVNKAITATTRLEGTLQLHQPAILSAIQEVLGIVGQHYEHSQQQSEHIKTATDEIKSGVNAIPSAIPPLLPAPEAIHRSPTIETSSPKSYDDTEVHVKLDDLLAHTHTARKALLTIEDNQSGTQAALARLDKLEKLDELHVIHNEVRSTAEEMTAMIATQTRLMAEHHDSRAEEAREAAIALEKRTAQKEKVEAEIIALTLEKTSLAEAMAALRREHEELAGQTKRLSREVGQLETALTIRQEEMRDMNARAETLERRVLEGVMNHARSIKFAKPSPKKKVTAAERDASMNLKRIPSSASNATAKAASVRNSSSTFGNAVGMALKKRNPLHGAEKALPSSRVSAVDRRILSTSHVTGNRASDAHRALVLAPSANSGLVSLKRSHSVKSNPSTYLSGRKPSWQGPEFVTDKENQDSHDEHNDHSDDNSSDAGTERRTSYTGTYTDSLVYGTGSSVSRGSMRSASYASSVGGTLNGHTESIIEEDEEPTSDDDRFEEAGDERAVTLAKPVIVDGGNVEADSQIAIIENLEAEDELGDLPDIQHHEPKYAVPSDSGIGSEPPTPDVSSRGSQAWQSTVST